MTRYYYSSNIEQFLAAEPDAILGQLLINDEFETTDLQKRAWQQEIALLQEQFKLFEGGEIAFEYTIPRIGHRVDAVIIISGIIFLLEFKVGDTEYRKTTEDQVMDYALDLKYFHEASSDKYIVPIIVSTEAESVPNDLSVMHDNIMSVLKSNKHNIGLNIEKCLNYLPANSMKMDEWINSRYAPTPTIIEAAQALYRNHSVADISSNDAGAENLTATTNAINTITAKKTGRKQYAL